MTTKISFANMIASLCNELPGADCDAVTNAMGADTRIGRKAFRGGVGYGGPCFPRDIKAFAALARDRGVITDLAEATDAINIRLLEDLAEIVAGCCSSGAEIAILGAAFKPKTNVIDASSGISLGRMLISAGYSVTYADPQADAKAIHAAVPDSRFAPDLCAALAQADVAVIMTPWPEFLAAKFGGTGKSLMVIDPWGAIERTQIGSGAVLFRPGRAPDRCCSIPDMSATDAPALP